MSCFRERLTFYRERNDLSAILSNKISHRNEQVFIAYIIIYMIILILFCPTRIINKAIRNYMMRNSILSLQNKLWYPILKFTLFFFSLETKFPIFVDIRPTNIWPTILTQYIFIFLEFIFNSLLFLWFTFPYKTHP